MIEVSNETLEVLGRWYRDQLKRPEVRAILDASPEEKAILLANVKEHAPPPLESEGAATEELHGGCCVSSCSPLEILSDVAEVSREEAEKMLEAAESAFGNLDEPPPLVLP